MKSSSRWLSGIGAAVLIGGLVLASGGSWVTPVAAGNNNQNQNNSPPPNPFAAILTKLDQVLAAIAGIGGGGAGNHTLRWDQALPAAQRFVVLAAFANAAVLDKNTGLVWEQAPAATIATWATATNTCINKNVGGQKGWRLPSIPELASLIDPTVTAPGPTLPAGHPFTNVQSAGYWSAATGAGLPSVAWLVDFGHGLVIFDGKTNSIYAWCVRGPMQESAY